LLDYIDSPEELKCTKRLYDLADYLGLESVCKKINKNLLGKELSKKSYKILYEARFKEYGDKSYLLEVLIGDWVPSRVIKDCCNWDYIISNERAIV
jgi:hypothetical protein